MYAGVVFILLGLFLNFIGGLSPQKLGAVSDIAKEMDSFAELVTFCIAPSILAYIVSLNTLPYIGVLCSLAFSICGVLRLSRINVEQNKLTLFTGMPIPFAAMYLIILSFMNHMVLLAIGTCGLSYLMVSKINFPHYRRYAAEIVEQMRQKRWS
ncbi:CDP-diacylglycerol--serine O-phosphatidyltransferase [Bacillus spizizenii ATCC 6633 = JCM 2499]|nr:CDP-diacylglycerol--serine O-phosphatidyltransferase [Bacillus spizizenii]MDR4203374.1 CDP-diacylglycerol--serine O-phosphatidyltransferase [Bacillus spizizenii ATCC 6633 = JCM 2499]QCJ17746.1 CDP-diacylglycerol--serine O-phosphatidyltransferase [Bacillus subtilis]QCY17983.1 CDP-diacylglycerol--serine O-phosphatidyltransferase [Bacillus spizizenii ATCC 6633 = JCM 2499]QDD03684.1 CDP-diacylglycerol--serine O-phosphatidyltransferase [Bacillus subtilis]